jgi:vitamin B12 transporter
MRRISPIWAVFFFWSSVLYAQSHEPIAGTILDPDHAAVSQASVRLLSSDGTELSHTLTDEQGQFSFSQTCTGCTLEVQLLGFQTMQTSAETKTIELQVAPIEEHVVVTANRIDTPTSLVGSTTTVITKEEIDSRQAPVVSDLLQSVPGVTVNRSGGYGTVTSIFVRGGESTYTKVMLDGIPMNDPGGAFDFGSLAATNLQRVEVVRGPQSALFGSDAMAGVVQLFSHRGDQENRRPQLSLRLDGGNLDTINAGADLNGQSGNFDYDAFWSRFGTDNQGINASFADSTAGSNLGLAVGKTTHLRWILRGDLSKAGTPGQIAFEPAIDDAYFHRGDGYTGFSFDNQTTHAWNQRLTYTFDRSRQVSRDFGLDPPYTPTYHGETLSFPFFDFPSDFLNDNRRHQVDYQSNVSLGSGASRWGQHTFTLAFSWDREIGANGDRVTGPFAKGFLDDFGGTLQHQMVIGRLAWTNGFRVEGHSRFGKTAIPRSSLAYLLRNSGGALGATKLKANFGLGFKEPSLVQLYSQDQFFHGNTGLRPERSRSFDFGVEQRLFSDRAKVEVNWFDNRFRDMVQIELTPTSQNPLAETYENLDASKANGAEVMIETVPRTGLRFTAVYTYLNGFITKSITPNDPVFGVGKGLLRRPRHSASLGTAWTWRKLTASSTLTYVGSRVDSDFVGFQPPFTSDPSYTRWNMAWAYRFTKRLVYVGTITNALDRSYMEALGFPALPIEFRMGGRFTF